MGTNKKYAIIIGTIMAMAFVAHTNAQTTNSESFDGATFAPTGWTSTNGTGGTPAAWSRVTSGTQPTVSNHSGAGMAKFNSYNASTSGDYATLITPAFDLTYRETGCTATVSFWMYRDNTGTQTDYLEVLVNTSASLTGATSLGVIYRLSTTAPTATNNTWNQYTYSIPSSFTSSNNYIIFKGVTNWGYNIFIDDVSYTSYPSAATPMSYSSSTTTQSLTSDVNPNTNSQQVIGVQVVTAGCASAINATSFTFNTTGTTAAGTDITNARLWSTGTSSTFATTTQVGTAEIFPSGTFTINGLQALSSGTNYFWLTYDIPAAANMGNYVDAECTSIVVDGTPRTPTATAPAGNRRIEYTYCTSAGAGGVDYLTNVNINSGGINNTTTVASPYYTLYSSTNTNLTIGSAYSQSYILTKTTSTASRYIRAYIDYNKDGDFGDAGENIGSGNTAGSSATTYTITPANFTVPACAKTGKTRMRVILGRTTDPTNPCSSPTNGEVEDYYVTIVDGGTAMSYTSSTSAQTPVTSVNLGTSGVQILNIQVVVANCASAMSATSFSLNTTGSTNAATDITNAKLWYTGTSSTFATTALYGSIQSSPNGAYTITGTQTLSSGTNYFWLTYDLPSTATAGDVIDAECTSITIGGTPRTPTTTAPAGTRLITNNINMSTASTTGCAANFYDSGGSGGSAGNNEDYTYTFYPSTSNGYVIATFSAFNVDNGWDYLYIYNGTSTAATLTGTYTGTTSPGTVNACNSSGALTFRFTSDASVASTGWTAAISCGTSSAPSAPTSSAATSVTCNAFTANWASVAGASSYKLDVATDNSFTTYVPGYQNLDVGNVTSKSVTGMGSGVTYYYRVRAVNCSVSGSSSSTQSVTPGSGTTNTYTGTSGNWNSAAKWSLGRIPLICDNAVIPAGKTVTIPDGYSAICNDLTIVSTSTLQIEYTTLGSGGDFIVYGNVDNSGSFLAYDNATGVGTVRTIYVYGNVTNNSGATWSNTSIGLHLWSVTGNITNAGTFNIDGFFIGPWYHTLTGNFVNTGTLNYTGTNYGINITGNFTNTGSVDLSGSLDCTVYGNFDNTTSGTFDHSGSGLFMLSGTSKTITGSSSTFTNNPKLTVVNGASYTASDNIKVKNLVINSTGALSLGASASPSVQTTLTQNGTINFSTGTLNYLGSTMPTLTDSKFNENTGTFYYANTTGTSTIIADRAITYYNLKVNVLNGTNSTFNNGTVTCLGSFETSNVGGGTLALTTGAASISGNVIIGSGTTFSCNNQAVGVGGNWTNNGSYTQGTNTVTFNGSGLQTIGGTTQTTFYNLTLNKSAGNTQLSGIGTTVSNVLSLNANVFDLNSQTLTLSQNSTGAITRTSGYVLSEATDVSAKIKWNVSSTNGSYVFPFGYSGSYIPFTFQLTDGGAAGDISVATYHTIALNTPWPPTVTMLCDTTQTDTDNNAYTADRFWQITKSGAAGKANITFTYADSEVPVNGEVDLRAQRWNGTGWDTWYSNPSQSSSPGSNTVTANDVTLFSPWALALMVRPLPVELLQFKAKQEQSAVKLNWETASEANCAKYVIERSTDGFNYNKIGELPGKGNSSILNTYKTIDNSPLNGLSFYRLQQIDFDGKKHLFAPVTVEFKSLINPISLYPNPTSSELHISYSALNKDNSYKVELLNTVGQVYIPSILSASEKDHLMKIDVTQLAPGMYILKLRSQETDEVVATERFTKN